MAKHSVLLRPFEVTLCPSLLNTANHTSFQPQYYLLFLSPSYRGLGGYEDSPDLYLQVLFTSFWWSRSGIITKIMCVFVVGGGKFQPCSEGCSVESKEIRSLDGSRTTESSKKSLEHPCQGLAPWRAQSTCGLFHKEQGDQDHRLRQPALKPDIRASARITPHTSLALKGLLKYSVWTCHTYNQEIMLKSEDRHQTEFVNMSLSNYENYISISGGGRGFDLLQPIMHEINSIFQCGKKSTTKPVSPQRHARHEETKMCMTVR